MVSKSVHQLLRLFSIRKTFVASAETRSRETTAGGGEAAPVYGLYKNWIFFLIHLTLFVTAIRLYRNPMAVIRVLKAVRQLRQKFLGEVKITRMTKVDGRFYWDLYTPGWPSRVFTDYLKGELNRISPIPNGAPQLLNIFFAVTKKCPLRCEHCFEWDSLNGKEKLTINDLTEVVNKFQSKGVSQIQFTGGEPMLRVDDLITVMKSAGFNSEYWVLTSGFHFTEANAKKLKAAGLTGVVVSLDHFDPEKHNTFRGHHHSFDWVQEAVRHALDAKLVTALSVCATRSFVTEENLMSYAQLAADLGVSFIQILEPKAVGHYKGCDVALTKKHEHILTDFFVKMNSDPAFSTYPMVCYHGYYQRRIGCLAAGNRSLYVDADGNLRSCPFSPAVRSNVLSDDLDLALDKVRAAGCNSFKLVQG